MYAYRSFAIDFIILYQRFYLSKVLLCATLRATDVISPSDIKPFQGGPLAKLFKPQLIP